MPSGTHVVIGGVPQPNSIEAIHSRIELGRVTWTGPILLLLARSVLLIASQGLTAFLLGISGVPQAWREAGHYWNVYGTIVDIGCLIGIQYFLGREGIRIRDLLGPIRLRRGHDLWLGFCYFFLVFPFFFFGGMLAHKLLYGSGVADAGAYLAQPHYVPLWALVYSLSLWWIIWSPTEELTYQGYVLPRMQALTGRTWAAFLIVGFWWAAQHIALAFIVDARFILFRFLAFLPGVLVMMAIYWKTRRLTPLIVAHWPMDIVGSVMMSGLIGH